MYAVHIVCCPLVSYVEYAPRGLVRLKKTGQTGRQSDGRTPDRYITLTVRRGHCNKMQWETANFAPVALSGEVNETYASSLILAQLLYFVTNDVTHTTVSI